MSKAAYVGVDGKARKVKSIYVGVPTQVPIVDLTSVDLAAGALDKFFTVQKSNGTSSTGQSDLDPDDYCSLSGDEDLSFGPWGGDHNSAWISGSCGNASGSGSISFSAACQVTVSVDGVVNDDDNYTYIRVYDPSQAGSDPDYTGDEVGTSWSGNVEDGWSIDFAVEGGSTDGTVSISIYDSSISQTPPGTPADFVVSDVADGGIKLVPGIFGEPLTWCEIVLTAKTKITGIVLAGEYHTEDDADIITISAGNQSTAYSGNINQITNFWTGELTEGQAISIKYAKDFSVNADGEANTFFKLTCDPVTVSEITGYETKNVARKVIKGYVGVNGVAKCFYGGK